MVFLADEPSSTMSAAYKSYYLSDPIFDCRIESSSSDDFYHADEFDDLGPILGDDLSKYCWLLVAGRKLSRKLSILCRAQA